MAAQQSSAETRWSAVLAQIEDDLVKHLDYLASDDDRPPPGEYRPPEGLPPIPDVLLPRAERLLSAIRQVTNELAEEHERIARELARLRRPNRPTTAPGDFDAHA